MTSPRRLRKISLVYVCDLVLYIKVIKPFKRLVSRLFWPAYFTYLCIYHGIFFFLCKLFCIFYFIIKAEQSHILQFLKLNAYTLCHHIFYANHAAELLSNTDHRLQISFKHVLFHKNNIPIQKYF